MSALKVATVRVVTVHSRITNNRCHKGALFCSDSAPLVAPLQGSFVTLTCLRMSPGNWSAANNSGFHLIRLALGPYSFVP